VSLVVALFSALGALRQITPPAVHPSRAQERAQSAPVLPLLVGSAEREVTLLELRANPGQWLGADVRLVLQFRAVVEEWNPYLSRFGPREWLAFEAWPDEVFTWDSWVFENPAARFFVRRGDSLSDVLRRSHAYQRFEAHARVREAFLGEPWLEIVGLVPLEGEVGEGTILHVGRARQCALERQWTLALEQYERAKSAPLPPQALAAIEKEILETREAQEHDERENPERADEQQR